MKMKIKAKSLLKKCHIKCRFVIFNYKNENYNNIFFLNPTLSVDLFLFLKNAKNATVSVDLFLCCLQTGIFRVIQLVVFGMSTSASGLFVNCVKLFK